MPSIFERAVQFLAGVIGIGVFVIGLVTASTFDANIASEMGGFLANGEYLRGLVGNSLLQFLLFSLLDLSLAVVSAFLIIEAFNRTGIFALTLIPAIVGVSYLGSVVMMDLIFYSGNFRKLSEDTNGDGFYWWPIIMSLVLELAAYWDREKRVISAEFSLNRPISTFINQSDPVFGFIVIGMLHIVMATWAVFSYL